MLIALNSQYDSEIPHPPIGTCGTVVRDVDEYGDYEIDFEGWPCPVAPFTWEIHKSMVIRIGGDNSERKANMFKVDDSEHKEWVRKQRAMGNPKRADA